MECQPQYAEFRIIPENFHPCMISRVVRGLNSGLSLHSFTSIICVYKQRRL